MKIDIVVIGHGNIGCYLISRLEAHFNCLQISAVGLSQELKNSVQNNSNINKVDVLLRLREGSYIIYAGKGGSTLDMLSDIVENHFSEYMQHFCIFGTNGATEYSDFFPRVILNSSINDKEIRGEIKESICYSKDNSDFEKNIVFEFGSKPCIYK